MDLRRLLFAFLFRAHVGYCTHLYQREAASLRAQTRCIYYHLLLELEVFASDWLKPLTCWSSRVDLRVLALCPKVYSAGSRCVSDFASCTCLVQAYLEKRKYTAKSSFQFNRSEVTLLTWLCTCCDILPSIGCFTEFGLLPSLVQKDKTVKQCKAVHLVDGANITLQSFSTKQRLWGLWKLGKKLSSTDRRPLHIWINVV